MAYQAITPTLLGQAGMTTTYLAIYTCPANTRTYVKDITIINTTSSAKRIYVNLVPDQGTVGTGNALFYNNLLPPYTTVQWTGAQILNESDTVQVKADATGCTVNVTGGEATE
jgi:hypothetical protein